jgi:hypothetical protein
MSAVKLLILSMTTSSKDGEEKGTLAREILSDTYGVLGGLADCLELNIAELLEVDLGNEGSSTGLATVRDFEYVGLGVQSLLGRLLGIHRNNNNYIFKSLFTN